MLKFGAVRKRSSTLSAFAAARAVERDCSLFHRVKFSSFRIYVQQRRGLLERDMRQNRKSKKSI
jgi:hypothetical protein